MGVSVLADTVAPTVSSFLTDVTSFFTSALSWVGSAIGTIMGNPLLLVAVACMPIAGYGVGLLRRLIRS